MTSWLCAFLHASFFELAFFFEHLVAVVGGRLGCGGPARWPTFGDALAPTCAWDTLLYVPEHTLDRLQRRPQIVGDLFCENVGSGSRAASSAIRRESEDVEGALVTGDQLLEWEDPSGQAHPCRRKDAPQIFQKLA